MNNFNDLTGVFDKEVSVFSNATTTTDPQHITIKELLSDIRGGKYAERINRARELKKINEDRYKAEKKTLPAFTMSAKCKHREKGDDGNKLIHHTGLLQIDVDGISGDDFQRIKNLIQSDGHTVFCFVSPSGNGLKAGIMIDSNHHLESFKQAERYYKESYGIEIDKATKDLYRPCFVSYDPELFVNPHAETFTIQVQEPPTENQDSAKLQKPKKKVLSKTTTNNRFTKYAEQSIENAKKIINESSEANHDRHDARLRAGKLLGGYIEGGFYDEQTALNAIESTVKNNTTLSIESAMKDVKDGIEHGKLEPITFEDLESQRETYLSQNGRTQHKTGGRTQHKTVNQETGEIIDDKIPFQFWYEAEKKNKQGETVSITLRIDAVKIYEYLKSIGVKRLRLNNDPMEPVLLVHIDKNIVTEIQFSELRTYIDRYIKSLPISITANHTKDDLREMVTKQARTFLTQEGLELNVDYEHVKFFKDKQDRGFVFYQNGFVEVTKDSMILKPYSELSGLIWKSQIHDREFTRDDDYSKIWNSNFCRWTRNICSLRLPNVDFEEPRWNALRCTIGYMLHNYIDQADVFAVILSESFLGDKPNGRTGKGLLVKALSKIRKRSYVAGKTVDFSRSFTLQTYQPNSDIFAFEDVLKNFDFERLFNLLTEGFSYELKGERAVNLPLSESPKIIITTNFAVQGTSGSFKARKYEMELLPYYNDDYTPVTEFGAKFFESWDAEQWNIFDNFMLSCMQEFFKNKNKIPLYESDTVNEKKLIHGTSADFVEFADGLKRNEFLSIGATYDNFIEETGENTNRFRKTKLSEWITLYCEIRKLKLKKPFPQHKINDKNQKCYYIES